MRARRMSLKRSRIGSWMPRATSSSISSFMSIAPLALAARRDDQVALFVDRRSSRSPSAGCCRCRSRRRRSTGGADRCEQGSARAILVVQAVTAFRRRVQQRSEGARRRVPLRRGRHAARLPGPPIPIESLPSAMANEVPKDSPAAAIIAEEERLFGQVQARVAMGEERTQGPAAARRERPRRRSAVAARPDRRGARRGSAAARRADDAARGAQGAARRRQLLPVDITSPYFAHMRLREPARSRDVMIGKRGFIDRSSQRADRRLAQRAGVADLLPLRRRRRLRGGDRRPPRRGHRRGAPQRVDRARQPAPHRHAAGHVPQGRARRVGRRRSARSRRSCTAAWARRRGRSRRPGTKGVLGIHHGVARADKALPEIAALIDKEQFELITQPGSGIVVIQGGAGSGKTTVALHRVAYLNFQDPRGSRRSNTLFVVPSQALVRYVARRAAGARRRRRAGRDVHGLGAHDAHALPARRADEVQRRAAGSGVARQEAPGDARAPRAAGCERRPSRSAASSRDDRAARVAEWNRLGGRALVPRLVGAR